MNPANPDQSQNQFRQEFIAFAIKKEVLRFGEFKTKAGRLSPYFFNAGLLMWSYKRKGVEWADSRKPEMADWLDCIIPITTRVHCE